MKRLLTILILSWTALAPAQSVRLDWDPSPSPGVVNYRIYYGTNTHAYTLETNAGFKLEQVVVLPHPGRWYFAATACDAAGNESEFSNEAVHEARPAPPSLHSETWVRLVPVIECSTNLVGWRSFTGEPTWIRATNAQEFFATRRLLIERVQILKKEDQHDPE